jgi:hypothetical protein
MLMASSSSFTVLDFGTGTEGRTLRRWHDENGLRSAERHFIAYLQQLHDFIRSTATLSQGLVIHWQRRQYASTYEPYLRAVLATLADAVFANPGVVQSLELWLRQQVEMHNKLGHQGDNCLRLWEIYSARKERIDSQPRPALPIIELPLREAVLIDLSSSCMLAGGTIPICE